MTGRPSKQPAEQVVFECHHTALFHAPTPKDGDSVYCRYCQDYTTVRVQPEYRIRCDSCKLSKGYGADIGQAQRTGGSHVLRFVSHTVTITNGDNFVEKIKFNGDQEELPYESVLSQRRRLSAWSQSLLPGRRKT